MRTIKLVLGFLVVSGSAFGADTFYVVKGKTVPAVQAMTAAVNGEDVYQCKPVELKVSKSGGSISLKAKRQAKRSK